MQHDIFIKLLEMASTSSYVIDMKCQFLSRGFNQLTIETLWSSWYQIHQKGLLYKNLRKSHFRKFCHEGSFSLDDTHIPT